MQQPQDAFQAFADAWNAHDMSAFGALFEKDATFVNRFAHYVKGVPEIVQMHRSIHETIYSDSTLVNELIDCRMVASGVAVAHFWCRLTVGAAHPAGPHAVDTLILSVLTQSEGKWRFKAVENVTLTNPRTGRSILRGDATS